VAASFSQAFGKLPANTSKRPWLIFASTEGQAPFARRPRIGRLNLTKEFTMQSVLTRIGAFGLIILIGFSLTAFGQAAWGIATLSA
jgi:hypothetical protein